MRHVVEDGLAAANPRAVDLLRRCGRAAPARRAPAADPRAEVREASAAAEDRGVDMKAVASLLGITDRTLRRRLAREGTSFAAIAHDVRFDVATRYLERTSTPIEEVAALAGFSDASNFRRVFICWAATSPAAFRRAARRRGLSVEPDAAAERAAID